MYIDPNRYTTRPTDGRIPQELAIYGRLEELSIPYVRVDHDHADTIEFCEQGEAVLGSKICKNLFLCNRQKTQFYLLMIPGDKVFHTRDLSAQIGSAFPSSPAAPGGNRRNVHRSRWGAPGWPRCCRA